MLLDALGAARDLGRMQEIASVLIRHGLGDAVRRLGMAGLFERAGRVLHWEGAEGLASKPVEQHFREALEDLGPTFVKLGQILAGRSDLLPPSWTKELERLRQNVAPVPFEELLPQLREDLGGEPESVFARFDREPLAAASIAQVHRAALADGTEVVVKVRRPGIEEVVQKDLHLLARIAQLAESEMPELRRFRPKSLSRGFARSMRAELDLRSEARNAERLASRMVPEEGIDLPRIHARFTRERLLVMDYFEGPSVGEWLDAGKPGTADAREIARRGADAVLRMVLVDGFFHADPHAGNLILLPSGRLGLLDFGLVGSLSEERRGEFITLLLAVVERRVDELVDLLVDWSQGGGTDLEALREDCESFVDRYHGISLAELDVTELFGDITELLRANDLSLPSDVAQLLRVLVVLDGLGRALDPAFVMSTHVEPFARRQARVLRSPYRMLRRGSRELRSMLARLPRDLRLILSHARRGNLRIEIDLKRLDAFAHQLDRSANRITVGLITASLIVGTAIAMNVDVGPRTLGLPLFALLGFLSSTLAGFWLLWSIVRSNRR